MCEPEPISVGLYLSLEWAVKLHASHHSSLNLTSLKRADVGESSAQWIEDCGAVRHHISEPFMTAKPIDDPVLRSARREMIVTFLIAATAMAWSVGYSYVNGYVDDPHAVELVGVKEAKEQSRPRVIAPEQGADQAVLKGKVVFPSAPAVVQVRDKQTGEVVRTVRLVLGFPCWIMWGVIVPWSICVVISFIFGATFMRDDDLGEDQVEEGGRDA